MLFFLKLFKNLPSYEIDLCHNSNQTCFSDAHIQLISARLLRSTYYWFLFVCFVALRPKSTAMVMAGWSVHLTTLLPGQA